MITGTVGLHKGALAIRFPYDAGLVERAKAIAGRRFEYATRTWYVPIEELEAVRKAFPHFQYDAGALELAQHTLAQNALIERERGALAPRLLNALGDLSKPLPDGRVLYEHQRVAVERMVRAHRLILADDMGLGKSLEALVTALAYQRVLSCRVLVIAPVSLHENWEREARGVGVSIETISWAKVPEPDGTDYVLIADEAHLAQNLQSIRTQGVLALAKPARAVFLLSGTPIKNGRPSNLFPLLVATQHTLAKNRREFELRYCQAKASRWSKWDTSGAAHLDELHAKTRDIILRRLKSQCLDLPEKTRVVRHAELSDAAQTEYNRVFATLRRSYHERIRAGVIHSGAEAMVELSQLRHAGSMGKVETALELAEEVIEEGSQVVLFTAFRDSAKSLAVSLNAETLSGDTPIPERQLMVDRFQKGEHKSIVCTFGAGGLGITLTAANTVILVDRPWTPSEAEQSEARLHRIGQHDNVTAIWLQADATDVAIDALLQKKEERIELVLEGKRKSLRGVGSPGDIAKEVLDAIME